MLCDRSNSPGVRSGKTIYPLLVCLALITVSCAAPLTSVPRAGRQQVMRFDVDSGDTLNSSFLLYLPSGYGTEDREWPCILYLHGASLRGRDIGKVTHYGLPAMLEGKADFPFIVISPQCLPDRGWTDEKAMIALLDDVCTKFDVDRKRIYLTGVSLGGRGAWYLASRSPGHFAAVAPLCGPADPTWTAGLGDTPVWVFHGMDDKVVPVDRSMAMVESMLAHGGSVRHTFYPDVGHNIVTRTYRNAELYSWFLAHKLE